MSLRKISLQEIYCQGCYSRKFGQAGYRGSATTTWADEQSNANLRTHTAMVSSTTRLIAGETDSESCIRCGGKVFEAEKAIAYHGVFHRTCYNCASCAVPLDSTRACDAPNREVYCKNCYGKYFGMPGYGHGGDMVTVERSEATSSSVEYHFTQFF